MSNYTQKERNGLYELTDSARAELASSKYYNEDLAPTSLSQRTWTTYHITSLWIGMSVCIPSFTMASSLVVLGLSPWLAVFNVAIGNILILIPIQLNSHAGTKYGIPFPVFARLTFGSIGAHIPSLSRALTACGWNAIQSWIGGAAIVTLIASIIPAFNDMPSAPFIGFGIFLLIVWFITVKGSESIKYLQAVGAPILVILTIALFIWSIMLAANSGYSIGDVIQAKTDMSIVNSKGGMLYIFLGGLTANISFWATMALNIPDFSRYAKSQKAQFQGQIYGMPIMMAACAFIGAFFAQSTKLALGTAIFNPTEVLPLINNSFIAFIVSVGVIIATLTTNIAANVVAPANGFSNISPKRINYQLGVTISCILAIAYRPWWIFGGAGSYIFGWLNTYGGILAPIAAIFIADYYIVKKRNIDVMALYHGQNGRYWYQGGWNIKAIIAWICGFILPTLGSLGVDSLKWVSANGYFVGFFIGLIVYVILMKNETTSFISNEEEEAMTER
ncbi:NCS1 family nucleobase:cation symporter-1 [Anaerovorax odorimutans]|uniref:NCS1 family nucleobase:cation symporter-1 n=1 Tax=Anaerovorax odorimutans TaxID=109327 RepID=UPI0004190DC5|nr:NCS1 family nucleobase:cation symporter-1 [Anaerovorax odorimutans]